MRGRLSDDMIFCEMSCPTRQVEADAARAAGTTVFAVGVGDDVPQDTLQAIAGVGNPTYPATDFEQLSGESTVVVLAGLVSFLSRLLS